MFVQVKWHGSGSSYFRRAPVDCTTRARVEELKCRPSRGIGSGAAKRPAPVSWNQSFENSCCHMTPIVGGGGEVKEEVDDDDDDAALSSGGDGGGGAGTGAGGYLPWELRLSVRKIASGAKPNTPGTQLGEAIMNLSNYVENIRKKRRQTKKKVDGGVGDSSGGVGSGRDGGDDDDKADDGDGDDDDSGGWGQTHRKTLQLSGGLIPLQVTVSIRTRPLTLTHSSFPYSSSISGGGGGGGGGKRARSPSPPATPSPPGPEATPCTRRRS